MIQMINTQKDMVFDKYKNIVMGFFNDSANHLSNQPQLWSNG